MDFRDLKIGYSSYSFDCSAPGDRRRFAFYAKEKGISINIADPSKEYDIVYITTSSNIGKWIDYKKANPGTKLIFEIIDSYLLEKKSIKVYLKGLFRYLTGKDKRFYLNYQNAFINIIKIADAVVCSTPIQQEHIAFYNKNVHISLDYFSDDITQHKKDITVGKKIKLVWEGQAYTVKNLLELNDVFKTLTDKVELHIITDRKIKSPFKAFDKSTDDMLKSLSCTYHLYDWEKESFSGIIAGCDLAIIPMSMSDMLIFNKPENKLLLFWEIGIPVLTSATPAYKRVMEQAGLDYYCTSHSDWVNKISSFVNNSPEQSRTDIEKALRYLKKTHNKEYIIKNWDEIFLSVR